MFVFEKFHSFFKFIFKATQLLKIPEYDIFQKSLIFASSSTMNSKPNAIPVTAGQYLYIGPEPFIFYFQKILVLEKAYSH